jgi:polysaccharide deacetylase 2 family uncharacterized protein YibQ
VLGGKNTAIGPGRRPPGSRGILAAAGILLLALFGGIAIWLSSSPPLPLVTRVEMALPAVPVPTDAEATGDAALLERGATGPLPRIAADGRKPWQVYARPFDRTTRKPWIAIVVVGLGPSAAQTDAAIAKLPGAVTLAFSPYTSGLPGWVEKARAAGHEIILEVPMEPVDFPREDPGPYSLLTTQTPRQNLDRLEWAMSRATGYVGLTNFMGSRFTAAPDALRPILEVVKGRGLLLLETRVSKQSAVAAVAAALTLPSAADDRNFDGDLSRAGIEQTLADLEQVARRKDAAIGIGSAYPITIERLAAWAETAAGKGVVLAPVSAMVTATEGTKEP